MKVFMKRRIFLTLFFSILASALIWYGLNPILTKNEPISTSLPALASGTVLSPAKRIEYFSLQGTATQKPFTQQDLLGHWTILFFGYAKCPAVCPQSLSIASDLWKRLPDVLPLGVKDKTQFVFITLDPKSDTIENLKSFLGRFNENFIGLTGADSEINKLAKSCRVYSFEQPTPDEKGQKIIDHTAAFILINPQGRIQALFSPPHDSELIAHDLSTILQN